MKKIIGVALAASLLVGCQYTENDMAKSQAACSARGGEFQTGATADGNILLTYCAYGGYRYTFNRGDGSYFDAERL